MLAGSLIVSIGLTKGLTPLKRSIAELPLMQDNQRKKVFYIGNSKELIRYTKSLIDNKKDLTIFSQKLTQNHIQDVFNTSTKCVIFEGLDAKESLSIDVLKLIPQLLEAGIKVLTSANIDNFTIAQNELQKRLHIKPAAFQIPTSFLRYISRVIVVRNIEQADNDEGLDEQKQELLSHIAFMIATHINTHNLYRLSPLNNQRKTTFNEQKTALRKPYFLRKLISFCMRKLSLFQSYSNQLIFSLVNMLVAFVIFKALSDIHQNNSINIFYLLAVATVLLNFIVFSFYSASASLLFGIAIYLLDIVFYDSTANILMISIILFLSLTIAHLSIKNHRIIEKQRGELREKTWLWDALNAYTETLTTASSIKEIFNLSLEYFNNILHADIILVLDSLEPNGSYQIITSKGEIVIANIPHDAFQKTYLEKYPDYHFLPLLSKDSLSLGYVAIKPLASENATLPLEKDNVLLNSSILQLAIAIQRYQLMSSYNEAVLTSEKEQLRSIILSSISHDLKTPLTTIIGSCTALEELENLPEKSKIMLIHTIHEASENLNQFISNILESSRLATANILQKNATVYLDDVINVTLQRCKKNIRLFDVSVNISNPEKAAIHADFTLIQQVLFNVIENAAKYSPIGGRISICITNVMNSLLIKVSDEGPGIPEDKRKKIFDKFYRFQHADNTKAGTGLGLSICKQIVDAYNGKIWVSDRDDGLRGAQFNIQLKSAFADKALLKESMKIEHVP